MKINSYLSIRSGIGFLFVLALSLNCSKDKNSTTPPPPPPNTTTIPPTGTYLRHDGGNLGAPTLDPDTYQAAARFSAANIGNLVGRDLIEVYYYMYNIPQNCKIKIYGPSTGLQPGNILYSADVTNEVSSPKWNTHKLAQPITLKAEDIWISVEFLLAISERAIGCDGGPGIEDGDWLYAALDSTWQTFKSRNGENINWNIRGKLSQ